MQLRPADGERPVNRRRLAAFIEEFQAAAARYAGNRLTCQHEILVRGVMASVVGRAYRQGVLPDDARLVVMRLPGGLAFRVQSEREILVELFLSGEVPRPRRRRAV